ncbi:DUF368 domain-containing protein [Veronia nyctiphanis]|uniref:DUF368 domain-containing protein n=1 Tax=Veronia nyctiphanis TaxID=1278244 RepID=A0A4Q0YTE5_9GAMM|nr:DUF368 domain-containing protein [Veronia nyctiphanis]RXJ74496.1 DUF368 domain-containing protein [Veronia nyctiphanis]
MKKHLLTFFKGMAMGSADVVPGVSGGTIAFITGIYDTLLESIRRVNPSIIPLWRDQGFKAVWEHINGSFLSALLSGILIAIFTLAKGVTWGLATYPIILWSFFFGLIVASALHMIKQIESWTISKVVMVALGTFFAWQITVANPLTLDVNPLTVFLAGSIAICAMILPGISGSLILLLLGMYSSILSAAKQFDVATLAIFASGCLVGLLSFSHVLSWLLRKYRELTMTFLTGLIIGALVKIWPWKEVISWRVNSAGEQVPLIEKNLLPWTYETVVSQPSELAVAIMMMGLGFCIVVGMEKLAHRLAD